MILQASAVLRLNPPLLCCCFLNTQAVAAVTWRRFSNHAGLLSCLAEQARGGSRQHGEAGKPEAWVDGWQRVVQEVGRIGQLAGCVSADRGHPTGSSDTSDVCGEGGNVDVTHKIGDT
jgi:hypothetical protein